MKYLLFFISLPIFSQSFFGVGMNAYPQSTPHPTGSAFYAILANASSQIYSVQELDFIPIGSHPITIQTTVQSGILTPMRKFGTMTLYAEAAAGASTSGVTSGSAFSGGGILTIPTKKLLFFIGVRALKTANNNTQSIITIGFGKVTK